MKLKKTAIALTVAGVLAAGAVWAQATGHGPFAGRRAHRLELLATYLDMTDAQRTQAKAIMDASRTATQPLMQQLAQGHQAMAAAVKANKPQADLKTIADGQASLVSQVAVQKALAVEQIWALLTPDQQAKADKLHQFFVQKFQDRMGGEL